MVTNKSSWVLFLTLLFLHSISYADIAVLTDETRNLPLGKHISYLEDASNSITFESVQSAKFDSYFIPSETENFALGYTDATIWLKLDIDNQTYTESNYFLEFANPTIDFIKVYYHDGKNWTSKKSGDKFPFEEREIRNRNFLFEVNVPTRSKSTIYIKIRTDGYLQIPLNLWKPSAFDEHNDTAQFIFGIISGIIGLMIINNLFLLFSLKNTSYIFYIMSMVFTLLLTSLINGHAYEYFWPAFPWVQNNIGPFLIASVGFWIAFFGYKFLDVKNYVPSLEPFILNMVRVSFVLLFIGFFLPVQYANYMAASFTALNIVAILVIGSICWSKGLKASKYFVIAFSIYLIGLLVYVLKSLALMPMNFITNYSVHFGAALQVTFLSFAMGSRVRELQVAGQVAQKEINEQLEKMVGKRTLEINRKTKELEEAYMNMRVVGSIGQEITASLDLEDIFSVLYNYVSKVMACDYFGIGIYRPERGIVERIFNMESGNRVNAETIKTFNRKSLAVWCIENKQEVFSNNYEADKSTELNDMEPDTDKDAQSLIYIPMTIQDRTLGTLVIQSYKKDSFQKQHLNIVRTLANYTAIALDNSLAYSKIESTNTNIVNSIRYAKRIQEAVLTDPETIKQHFKDGFVFYRPRDIVSGDFYWYNEKEDKLILAVIDCTGHGVPGAFMTMMANDFLNQIVIENNITSPKKILKILDNKLSVTFHTEGQEDSKIRDGMDMTICTVYWKRKRVHFASAKQSIFYVKSGGLEHVKGSKFPIGGKPGKFEKEFEESYFPYEPGDRFYMFSDGYQDQFGGENGKKFMIKKFRELTSIIQNRTMSDQGIILQKAHDEWKGMGKQTDDVLVMGLEF